MLDIISQFFLAFSNAPLLLLIIIPGLALRPKFFVTPIFLLLFTMIFSAVLKLVFAVPYSPELVEKLGKNGFSFPSGHMQASAVFYGWLMLHCKNKWLKIALVLLLFGIAFLLHLLFGSVFLLYVVFVICALHGQHNASIRV